VHRIRLSAAWNIDSGEKNINSTDIRIHLPHEPDVPLDEGATLRLLRRFHRPTGLAEDSQVRLVLQSTIPVMQVVLNEQAIAATAMEQLQRVIEQGEASWLVPANEQQLPEHVIRFDIGTALQPFNHLSLTLTADQLAAGVIPLRGAWLEISDSR
jgi:hypothetical protein